MTTKPIHQAYERCKAVRAVLTDMDARCIEATEDKCGILWERWVLPNGKCAVLWATPHGWDVFLPASNTNSTDDTIAALRLAAGLPVKTTVTLQVQSIKQSQRGKL